MHKGLMSGSENAEKWNEAERDLLRICHLAATRNSLIHDVCSFFQNLVGCEAVGVRLCHGNDFPYFETRGFPSDFVTAENSLCVTDEQGRVLRDDEGLTVLECTCGNVLCGNIDRSRSCFTPKGSFWMNSPSESLGHRPESRARRRDRCINDGYQSVALLPIRSRTKTLGLVQLNDRKAGLFSAQTIEALEHLVDYVALALAKQDAEEAVLKSEALLKETQRLTKVGGWEYDIEKHITYWADETFRIHGISLEDSMSVPAESVARSLACYDEADRPLIERTFRLCVEQGVPYDLEVPFTTANGDRIWVRTTARAMMKNGRPVKVIGYLMDITERKQAEEEQARLQAQLTHAQRMESIGRLAGGVAHDFNNMLMVILGHTELALESLDPKSSLHADLREIHDAARRSADLTRQLLAFARRQVISPKRLNLNDAVSSMLKMLQRLIGEDIDLVWLPAEDLWPVLIDPAQVDQILANLSVNARDAISGVGRLVMKTKNIFAEEMTVAALEGDTGSDYVLLSISDTGCGMSSETLDHLFEPFYTTKKPGKGTGLGLATVYGIVKQNHGLIDVQSEQHKGTCLNIYLPRCEETASAVAERAEKSPLGGKETILLVEDEESLRKLGKKILSFYGYNVLVAASASEAMDIVQNGQNPVSLLITDVVMPAMNGKDLEQRLRPLCPDLRVLFMSGYTTDIIASNGIIEEGIQFLQKPFTVETLALKVRQALDS